MGVYIEMRFTSAITDADAKLLSWRLSGAFWRADTFWFFDVKDQAIELDTENRFEVPVSPGKRLWKVRLIGRYYGPDYERGEPWTIVAVAQWLEANVPDAMVFYGGDNRGDLEPFGQTQRAALMEHWFKYGHQPYQGYGTQLHGENPPMCRRCGQPMMECGGGGSMTFWFCYGCPDRAITDRGATHWIDRKAGEDAFFKKADELRKHYATS